MPEFNLPPVTVSNITTHASEVPWGIKMINAPNVWDKTKGKGVIVAVLDTGCDTTHPDLQGRIIGGRNFTDDFNSDPNVYEDNQGHGTHCAGTIAAISNGYGVVGGAPEVSLLIGKVLDKDGSGTYQGIIEGIRWAVDWRGPFNERVRIISMSLGGPQGFTGLHRAIQYAVDNNVLVVAASGNEGDGNVNTHEYSYPGAYNEVVEVGAIDSSKRLAHFSNTNEEMDVVSPGVDIMSTIPGGQWAKFSGTSMATPHVAAVGALLLGMYETIENPITEPVLYDLIMENTINTVIVDHGEGKGIVSVKMNNQVVKEPVTVPVPRQPNQSPQPDPTPTRRDYSIKLRKVGSRYSVEVGGLLSYTSAVLVAKQAAIDLDSVPGVNAVFK